MAIQHQITIDGQSFLAPRGQLLLDAALNSGIALPHECRAGHCGTCCVRLVSGHVQGAKASDPEKCMPASAGSPEMRTLRLNSDHNPRRRRCAEFIAPPFTEVLKSKSVGQVSALSGGSICPGAFQRFPSRPFSMTHPLRALHRNPNGRSVWFHVRRMNNGRVSPALGKHIRPGHQVELTGPYGLAHFRPNGQSPLILIATHTGFAPIWSIAVAALRKNPERDMMVIAGGRTLESLYMWPALARLATFPNVHVVPVCSTPQTLIHAVQRGRPTDYLPPLLPGDVLHACGAPGMVNAIKEIAARFGAVCYADPFLPTTDDTIKKPPWIGRRNFSPRSLGGART